MVLWGVAVPEGLAVPAGCVCPGAGALAGGTGVALVPGAGEAFVAGAGTWAEAGQRRCTAPISRESGNCGKSTIL